VSGAPSESGNSGSSAEKSVPQWQELGSATNVKDRSSTTSTDGGQGQGHINTLQMPTPLSGGNVGTISSTLNNFGISTPLAMATANISALTSANTVVSKDDEDSAGEGEGKESDGDADVAGEVKKSFSINQPGN